MADRTGMNAGSGEGLARGQTGPARLLIVDDHELAREGLRSMLERETDLEVVAEAMSGQQAVEKCQRLQPDLVLMDVRMPDLDGLTATRQIKQTSPQVAVLVVTMHAEPEYLFEAVKAGAAGYVLKDASKRDILAAVRAVLRGESLLEPRLAARLLQRLAAEAPAPVAAPADALTPREQEVLRQIAAGKTNREIAEALVVSTSTAKSHVEHIIRKLSVSDRTQAAVRAIELGYVPTSTP